MENIDVIAVLKSAVYILDSDGYITVPDSLNIIIGLFENGTITINQVKI